MLVALFFVIALLYSMVGFGGGSSYTALLALSEKDPSVIRSTALCCNLAVVSVGLIHNFKNNSIPWRTAFTFLVFSVPVVFITARWQISDRAFFLILGIALIIAGALMITSTMFERLLTKTNEKPSHCKDSPDSPAPLIPALGIGLGALAGLTGIGGGIYLSPVLNLIRFDSAKRIAGIASLFIWVNSSIALLSIYFQKGEIMTHHSTNGLLLAVISGGVIGSTLLQKKLEMNWVRQLTGVLIIAVGGRVLFQL